MRALVPSGIEGFNRLQFSAEKEVTSIRLCLHERAKVRDRTRVMTFFCLDQNGGPMRLDRTLRAAQHRALVPFNINLDETHRFKSEVVKSSRGDRYRLRAAANDRPIESVDRRKRGHRLAVYRRNAQRRFALPFGKRAFYNVDVLRKALTKQSGELRMRFDCMASPRVATEKVGINADIRPNVDRSAARIAKPPKTVDLYRIEGLSPAGSQGKPQLRRQARYEDRAVDMHKGRTLQEFRKTRRTT